jgi:putative ABC transport system permease protein
VTLFEFAWKNISRDKRNYIYYFANCAFSVFVFFLFSVLSFHPALAVIDPNSTMGLTLAAGEAVSVAFSICFISYSMRCFLKNRSRQLGLITILGASKKQLNRLVFLENMLVGILSIVTGILFGIVFSKFFLDIANRMIGVSEFVFYFPVQAMLLTVVVMGFVFFGIAYFTPKFIRKKEVVKLLKADAKDDKQQKLVPALVSFLILTPILLWGLAGSSDFAHSMQESFFLPFLLVVDAVLGTYLLISFGMRLWLIFQTKSRSNVRLLCMGDQRAKLKTNAQSMTISALLYAVAFFAVIVLFSMSTNVKSETEKILPYAMTYNTWTEEANAAHDLAVIENELRDLPGYKTVDVRLWYPSAESRSPIMSQRDYNQIMDFLGREPVSVSDTGVYLVTGNADEVLNTVPSSTEKFFQSNYLSLSVEGQSDKVVTLTGFTNGICVVSDYVFASLKPQLMEKTITAFSYDNWESNSESPDAVFAALETTLQKREANVVSAYRYYRSSQIQNNLTLYIGGMLSFVFLLAVASFIYSRLYSELDAECRKFKGIVKIGLSKKELSMILSRLIFLILCVPFGLALVYLWIGIFLIEQFALVSVIPVALGFTAILIVLQIVLYLWIRVSYRKTVFQQVFKN